MNKKSLIVSLITSALFMPLLASAQLGLNLGATSSVQIETAAASEAQILTACSQTSIEIRDSAIGSARSAYNNSMAVALDTRKEAEKRAVALLGAAEKKEAIRVAVEDYKKAVTQAQDGLTRARKDAWATFESNTKACRDMNNDKREAFVADKKTNASEKKTELRTMQTTLKTDIKAAVEDHKTEAKSIRETLKEQLDSIKAFFKLGASVETTTN